MERRNFVRKLILLGIGTGIGFASYNIGTIGFLEAGKSISDAFKKDINKGTKKLDDSHAHFNFPKNDLEMKLLINTLLLKIERQAITYDTGKDYVDYNSLVNMIKDYSSKNPAYQIEDKGLVSIIKKGELRTEVYKSQEIRTLQGFHIVGEGCNDYIPNHLDARKTIEEIRKQKGIAVIAHPFTVENKHLIFWYPDSKQRKLLEEELIPAADSVEVFNAMNIAHMTLSNAKIKYLLKYKKTIKGIAVTDTHNGTTKEGLHQIGRAGILYNEFNVDNLSDREIFEKKKLKLKLGDYGLFENYINPITFFKVAG